MTKEVKVIGMIPGYTAGQVFTVPCDDNGILLDPFWRQQLRYETCEMVTGSTVVAKPKRVKRKFPTLEGEETS